MLAKADEIRKLPNRILATSLATTRKPTPLGEISGYSPNWSRIYGYARRVCKYGNIFQKEKQIATTVCTFRRGITQQQRTQ